MSNSIPENETVIVCNDLTKTYSDGANAVEVLKGINLSVARGEMLAIIGASGSGKSTLLNLLGALDAPSSGSVSIAGKNTAELNEKARGLLRNQYLGFVYQFHHLLNEFSALENVAMPLLIAKEARKTAYQKAEQMLARVGLEHRSKHRPAQLSGGERQRVAIARSLVNEPQCVLMDEPTGNLDRDTAATIHKLMNELNETMQTSFIIVTHDNDLAAKLHRQLRLTEGTLHTVEAN